MTVHYADDQVTLHHGDCLDVLRGLPDASVDAVVTDPPYGLGFMGKAWDDLPPGEEWARECLRVLKPGGHLLAFGGSRTWHRLAVAVEDAGFEVRDSIAWLYGSGFPKSLDVSKAVDKLAAAAERRARALEFTAWVRSTGITTAQINDATGTNMGGHYTTAAAQPAVATADLFDQLRPYLPAVPARIEELVAQRTVESANYKARPVTGIHPQAAAAQVWKDNNGLAADLTTGKERRDIPATDAARRWQGWGTALKPAFEPIVVARKPLAGTVAANVLAHGTGALNVDGCRVGHREERSLNRNGSIGYGGSEAQGAVLDGGAGRWPTNVVLDGHAAEELDRQSGNRPGMAPGVLRRGATTGASIGGGAAYGTAAPQEAVTGYGDTGGASRFFPTFRYQAKAPTRERIKVGGVAHPTVKPLALMQWLVRLVTPPGGVVLEPFAGSGTTVEAALLEGVRVVAIEREADYLPLIRARIDRATPAADTSAPEALSLFDETAA